MEWVNKITWFILGLIALGISIALIRVLYETMIQMRIERLRQWVKRKRALSEAQDILAERVIPPSKYSYEPQDDGGMIVRTYKHGALVETETYTSWEWEQTRKVDKETVRMNKRK